MDDIIFPVNGSLCFLRRRTTSLSPLLCCVFVLCMHQFFYLMNPSFIHSCKSIHKISFISLKTFQIVWTNFHLQHDFNDMLLANVAPILHSIFSYLKLQLTSDVLILFLDVCVLHYFTVLLSSLFSV